MMRFERLPNNPIVRAGQHPAIGENVNGPSLIRVPGWVERPLGRYYLYFAHHQGETIRLAYADDLGGPWRIHPPGVLGVDETACEEHIASPDVHVDEERREIRMYFHGPSARDPADGLEREFPIVGWQRSFCAVSSDGLRFVARPEVLGAPYFRVLRSDGWSYALGMPGLLYRSQDGLTGFERGPALLGPETRHTALLREGDRLWIYYSVVGQRPERIVRVAVELRGDWRSWRAGPPEEMLAPETDYEGASLPLEESVRGWAPEPVRQLRDPAIFQEGGATYLLYSVAGEQGIAIARITDAAP
jgi:hypothetical protein